MCPKIDGFVPRAWDVNSRIVRSQELGARAAGRRRPGARPLLFAPKFTFLYQEPETVNLRLVCQHIGWGRAGKTRSKRVPSFSLNLKPGNE